MIPYYFSTNLPCWIHERTIRPHVTFFCCFFYQGCMKRRQLVTRKDKPGGEEEEEEEEDGKCIISTFMFYFVEEEADLLIRVCFASYPSSRALLALAYERPAPWRI